MTEISFDALADTLADILSEIPYGDSYSIGDVEVKRHEIPDRDDWDFDVTLPSGRREEGITARDAALLIGSEGIWHPDRPR